MYKLMVIAGPNRGTSYALSDGEISVGRQSGNTIVLPSAKISKQHCVFTVQGNQVVLKDVGSSNGTFVNGALTKLRGLKVGDRVSIGEYVLQVVEPAKPAPRAAPAVAGLGKGLQLPSATPQAAPTADHAGIAGLSINSVGKSSNLPPTDLKGKVIWYFENRVMPIFYGLNLKHEWRMMAVGGFAIFIVGNLVISVNPLIQSSENTVVKEAEKRARFIAREIAERNAPFLAGRAETKTDIGLAERTESVRLVLLMDLDNRIIAPATKMNQYLVSGEEAAAAVTARNRFREGRETGITTRGTGTIIVVEPVKVLSPTQGRNVVAAMALVSIDTSLSLPDVGELGVVYSETLIFTGILGGIILLILYRLTLKPFQVLNEDMDKALKGDLSQVTHEFKFEELDPLWEIINSAILRIPKGGTPGEGVGLGGPVISIDDFLGPLRMIGTISKFGFVVFDSEKKIVYLNSIFEELSGIRSEAAMGQEMKDVARDQAMGAFAADLLDRIPVGGEGLSEDYDFSGVTHKVHAAGFGAPGGTAKCYVMVAVRAEG